MQKGEGTPTSWNGRWPMVAQHRDRILTRHVVVVALVSQDIAVYPVPASIS